MTISRRNFVRAAVGGLAAAALPRHAFGMEAAFDRNARIGGLDFGDGRKGSGRYMIARTGAWTFR